MSLDHRSHSFSAATAPLESLKLVGSGAAAIGGAILVAVSLSVLLTRGMDVVAIGVAALLGLVVGVLALTRFDWFVLLLLVTRSSLDALGRGGLDGGAVDPAAAVGAVFVASSFLWLLMKYYSGEWVRPSAPTKALLALGGAGVISVVNSPARIGAAEGATRLVAGVLMFAVLEQLLARRRTPHHFLAALFAAGVVPMLVAYVQLVTGTGATDAIESARVYGTFAHPNVFASFIVSLMLVAIAVAVGMREEVRLRRLAILVAVVAGPLLIFTYTRAAWLALVVGLVYLGLRLDRRILALLGIAAVVTIIAAPSIVERITDVTSPEEVAYDGPTNSFEWRLEYWGQVLPLASDSPMTGIGIDVTQRVTDSELPPHNTFVQAYVEAGILGLAAVLVVVATFASHLRRRVREATTNVEFVVAVAAVAVGIATLAEAPSENLLSRTIGYWYTALAMLHGFRSTGLDGSPSDAAKPRASEPQQA